MELHVSQFMGQGASALPSDIRVVKQLKAMTAEKINDITVSAKSLHTDITPEQTATIGMLTVLSSKCEAAIDRDEREYGTFAGGRNRGSQRPGNPMNLVAPGADAAPSRRQRSNGWLSKLMADATSEQREELENMMGHVTGRMSALSNLAPTGDGGNLIPQFVAQQIEMNVAAFTPVLNVSKIYGTEDGAAVVYPVLSDSESAVQLAAEDLTGLDDVVSGDTPPTSLTGPKLQAWKISSKPVLLPRETQTDTGLDIAGDILAALIARISRYENLKYTKGNGTTEAQGFLTACTHYDVSAALSFDVTRELTLQVPPLYRPNGVFMMSDATIMYLRGLKTGLAGDQRTIWTDANAITGEPARLHGYPVYHNNDMPDINASTGYLAGHEVAFGDFSRFVIRRAEFGTPFVYSWPIPAKDGRALIAFRRSDSKLLVPTAIATVAVGGS